MNNNEIYANNEIYVDYVFLNTEERKLFNNNPPDIEHNEFYRVYNNIVILFIKEQIKNMKY